MGFPSKNSLANVLSIIRMQQPCIQRKAMENMRVVVNSMFHVLIFILEPKPLLSELNKINNRCIGSPTIYLYTGSCKQHH